MSEQEWQRKEYETWDEAFRGLSPVIRQQSVRIAEYTQTIFTAACSSPFGKNAGPDSCMSQRYADTAFKCGLYHQIGKALVSPDYQFYRRDFTKEEKELYRKYTTDGRLLVARLQETGAREKKKRSGGELPTKKLPWLMIREACEQHMERFDGKGFPKKLAGKAISPIAHIVGIAKELDRISSETRAEDPFGKALAEIYSRSGKYFDPELVDVLRKCAPKCRAVYEKFIYYTMTIPKTVPLVVKKDDRPMGLRYRPVISSPAAGGKTLAYDAIPWFGGIVGSTGETETAEEIDAMLKRTGLTEEVSFYLMYEAADALYRLKNCGIETAGVILEALPSFFRLPSRLSRFAKLFADQPVDKEKLMLAVPPEVWNSDVKAVRDILSLYLRNGIVLVADGYLPGAPGAATLADTGFRYARLSPELASLPETPDTVKALAGAGIRVICSGVVDEVMANALAACGAPMFSGPASGVETDEDGMIAAALAELD